MRNIKTVLWVALLGVSIAMSDAATNATGIRYWRGSGNDANSHSFVIPLDGQRGTAFDDIGGVATNYFPFWSPWTLYHYNNTNPASASSTNGRIVFENPIAGFGSRVGGSPLYTGSKYRWGFYGGHNEIVGPIDVWIEVYWKTNGNHVADIDFYVPNQTEVSAWRQFATNDFTLTTNSLGLTASLRRLSGPAWGLEISGLEDNAYVLTVQGDTSATNYIYDVFVYGQEVDHIWLVLYEDGEPAASDLFTMEFETRPPLRSKFIDQPHFTGAPLPPEYAGKSLEELMNLTAVITNEIWLTNNVAYTTLDDSPELRRHPILDQFVAGMRNDPLALTAYVLNEIELTDPLGYGKSGEVGSDSVNHGGIARNALGTFLERQGSPAEICALLVYLLRQAGYHAGFVFATNNNLKLLDTRLSKLLRMQIKNAVEEDDSTLFTTNKLIVVNYPWVVANVSGECVHIFPWLKDTEVKEGLELWLYMPTNMNNGYKWVREYVFGNSELLNLGAGETDSPAVIFPRWIIKQLRLNHPGISIDDIGVKCLNRRKDYHAWDELPIPSVLSSQDQIIAVQNLAAVTNAFPSRTNQFDSVQVQILRGANVILNSGQRRMADVHNRKFLVYTNEGKLRLWLEEFRAGFGTNELNFAQDSLTNRQAMETALQGSDDSFDLRITFRRQRWLTNQTTVDFMDYDTELVDSKTFSFDKDELVAICLDYGRVTPQMLHVHLEKIWREELLKSRDAQYEPEAKVDFEGTAAYLMGMTHFARVGEFDEVNGALHKLRTLSILKVGLGKFKEVVQGGKKLQPMLDMTTLERAFAGNRTIRPDRHEDNWDAMHNYRWIDIAARSAEEHETINDAFGEKYAISTVKLLQLAQARSGPHTNGIVVLDVNNYVNRGGQTNAGYGSTTFLRDFDTGLWKDVTNDFQSTEGNPGGRYTRVFITPGPILSESGKYKGMGALILAPDNVGALISGNLNGGAGSYFGDPTPIPNSPYPPFTTKLTREGVVTYAYHSPGHTFVLKDNSPTTVIKFYSSDFNVVPTPDQTARSKTWTDALDLSPSVPEDEFTKTFEELKPMGAPEFWINVDSLVSDPVHPVTGAFYVDAVDLRLPGPMPLELRRNYSSQNRSWNQLGHGWKLNYMPQLVIRTNSAGTRLIDAAEPDGSVIAYRKTNSIWIPFPEDNPGLSTHTTHGIGSKANLFNSHIEKLTNGSVVHYYLYSADGSVRNFKMDSFPMTALKTNGTATSLQRTRPYLESWRDHRGNSYRFFYEGDSNKVEYGQVTRVESSNGNFLGFRYDTHSRIAEVFAGDGRRLYYGYDEYGDLVRVTLPDGNRVEYAYEHYPFTWTNQFNQVREDIDSYHLLTRERKPDGRILANEYDNKRRVTNQLSTVGGDLNLIRNATFAYSNNFNLNKAHTNMVSGYTLITDINNNVTRYDYTNGLITRIVDALNQTNSQEWYWTGDEEPGAYRRSLKSETDKRGLKTTYKYDTNGNVANVVVTGDLTGDGVLTQSATNTFAYNTNNLLIESIDSSGRKTEIQYHPSFRFLPEFLIASANGTVIATNFSEYYSVTNITTNGGNLQITNIAMGVLRREIRAYGSSDASTNEWERNGRGFITKQIQHTGTSDPSITNFLWYNGRGELVEKQDTVGRTTVFDYDGLGRLKWTEVRDETGKQLSGTYTYYNANGEVQWVDGPRYDPEDYVWNDYDGAGRQITQIGWRSQAKADGSGVEAVPGYDQFATTWQEWDGFGNLTKVTDPSGVVITNSYDAIGQKLDVKILDANGAVLKSESFAYEPGGQISFHTNAIGGVTEHLYTSTGKPRYQKNPDGSTNEWRYDLGGRTKREIQPNRAYWETSYDDENRRVTRIFYSEFGGGLATNVTEFDRRGNVIRAVDAAGFAITNAYDGLNRIKWTAGPVVTPFRPTGAPEFTPLPSSIQEAITNYYDAAGAVVTNVNALGHKAITWTDALGRVARVEHHRNGISERQSTTAYAANHHSVTVTNGFGSTAIASTSYTDNSGNPVLSVAYPAAGVRHFTRSVYDSVGNLTFQTQASVTNGTLAEWSNGSTAYDGLGRPTWKSERDGAVTTFQYDPAGNLTNRVSPGGLTSRAAFNSKGQKTTDYILGGSLGSRTNTYSYSSIGLLGSRTDGRGIFCEYFYDEWMRPQYLLYDGSADEHDVLSYFAYNSRGLIKRIEETFLDPSVGPDTAIYRTYNAYGHLESESVTIGGTLLYGVAQSWDAAGRRDSVGYGTGQFGFNTTHRSDGLMNHFYTASGSSDYLYNTAGHLDTRVVTPYFGSGMRMTRVGQRDGMGRPLSITNTINDSVKLLESLTWTGDGLLATHSVSNALFLDERAYTYAHLTRRLTEERLNLDASRRHTNIFTFDTGQAAGPGVLTKSVAANVSSPVTWSGGADPLLQLTTETNNAIRRAAYGRVNGPATVQAFLDGQPVPLTVLGTEALSWHATLELSPGSHQLQANALHSSGLYTAATNHSFTVTNTAADRVQVTYDAIGQITQKIWLNSNGATNRTQTFRWDAKGRLHKVIERDSAQTGYDWTAVYDALNRRLQTTTLIVTNGAVQTNQPTVIKQFYDPQHAFLEIAVSINGRTIWKVIGPSLNGSYGSLSGLGGLEATVTGLENFGLILSDARGNILGVYDPGQGTVSWNTNRPTGYGAVPGHRPPPLGHGADLVQASSWRGRWSDIHGNIQLAYRPYDPVAARFLAFDPLGGGPSDNPFGFPADPINYDDPLGLFGIQPLKYDSSNPVAELLNAMDQFDAGMGDFHATLADAAVSSHMNLMRAINAETASFLQAASIINQFVERHWDNVFQQGMADEARKVQNAHLQNLANPPPEMSYLDKWKYLPTETFEKHLIAAAELTTLAVPIGGAVRGGVGIARTIGGTAATAGEAAQAGLLTRAGRFFYDNRSFRTISREYWDANGPASGSSLHHWLIPQRADWVPQGIRNAGFNLIELPPIITTPFGGLNQWMGMSHSAWAPVVDWTIRLGIPASIGGAAYGGARTGEHLFGDEEP